MPNKHTITTDSNTSENARNVEHDTPKYHHKTLEPILGDSHRVSILAVLLDGQGRTGDDWVSARDLVTILGVDRDLLKRELHALVTNNYVEHARASDTDLFQIADKVAAPLRVIQGLSQRGDT